MVVDGYRQTRRTGNELFARRVVECCIVPRKKPLLYGQAPPPGQRPPALRVARAAGRVRIPPSILKLLEFS